MDIEGRNFAFPGVTLSIKGKLYIPDSADYECDELVIKTSWEKRGDFYFKKVAVTSKVDLPTPDYIEIDRQTVDDETLRFYGYIPSGQKDDPTVGEEEGSGVTPECGYPLIGKDFFTGLAHPAGFNQVVEENGSVKTYSLRHHPVWKDGKLETVEAVYGRSDTPFEAFKEYIDSIRIPLPLDPYFAFCSFWSDPYVGNYEYEVTGRAMKKFIKAFEKFGLEPDAYTFDAGWQNRKSIFQPKEGLDLNDFDKLSLWISHNGPMGTDPEYLKSCGYEIGKGRSSGYCGEGYAVMLDEKYEEAVRQRFSELAKKVSHFKIDWDNECATNEKFAEKYPSRDHVREGHVNATMRIMKSIREAHPDILARVGLFWPSPWALLLGQQVFVVHSGDSEYSSVPSLHQRAAAATHRDFMYYNMFVRDRNLVPFNSLDNHEFPNSIRNVFLDDDRTWMDNLIHCVMRGSTYFTWTVQPESLTPYRIEAMKQVMEFTRAYKAKCIVKDGFMVGGNPGLGEVYGFKQNNWVMLRNPAPMPQYFELPEEWGNAVQFYPVFAQTPRRILLLPEEIKVFELTADKLPYDVPFYVENGNCYFPGSLRITEEASPIVDDLHCVPDITFEDVTFDEENGNLLFSLTTPYRMDPLELRLAIPAGSKLRVTGSRYGGIRTTGSTFAPAITQIPQGVPGYGENHNPVEHDWKDDYYSIPVPPGGKTYYVFMFGSGIKKEDIKLWCLGYEPSSRGSVKLEQQLLGFDSVTPPHSPAGFPRAKELKF